MRKFAAFVVSSKKTRHLYIVVLIQFLAMVGGSNRHYQFCVEVNELIRLEAEQLCQALNDTITLSGSEAYTAALAYYSSVKQAAKANVPHAGAAYEDLRKRFERK